MIAVWVWCTDTLHNPKDYYFFINDVPGGAAITTTGMQSKLPWTRPRHLQQTSHVRVHGTVKIQIAFGGGIEEATSTSKISQWDSLYIILQPKPWKLRSATVVKGHEDINLQVKSAFGIDPYKPTVVDPLLSYPLPPCISYALVQATVGVGTVIVVYVILITYEM